MDGVAVSERQRFVVGGRFVVLLRQETYSVRAKAEPQLKVR